jgi:hypothetical protein
MITVKLTLASYYHLAPLVSLLFQTLTTVLDTLPVREVCQAKNSRSYCADTVKHFLAIFVI